MNDIINQNYINKFLKLKIFLIILAFILLCALLCVILYKKLYKIENKKFINQNNEKNQKINLEKLTNNFNQNLINKEEFVNEKLIKNSNEELMKNLNEELIKNSNEELMKNLNNLNQKIKDKYTKNEGGKIFINTLKKEINMRSLSNNLSTKAKSINKNKENKNVNNNKTEKKNFKIVNKSIKDIQKDPKTINSQENPKTINSQENPKTINSQENPKKKHSIISEKPKKNIQEKPENINKTIQRQPIYNIFIIEEKNEKLEEENEK